MSTFIWYVEVLLLYNQWNFINFNKYSTWLLLKKKVTIWVSD